MPPPPSPTSPKLHEKGRKTMKPEIIIHILRLILCNQEVMTWLENEASKTGTPIDDEVLRVLKLLLCGQ
jgi:hypothetical protein